MNRKSMIATGAALILLLGGAAGAYFYVDHKKASEDYAAKAEKEALKLFNFDSNLVKGIDITTADGYFNMSVDQAGDWHIDETDYPYDFPLNSYYLNVVAASMSGLTADHKADVKNDELAKYGLDSPVTVVCHTPDADYTVYVGNSSVTNEFSYVMLPGNDTVYCIDNGTGNDLRGDISLLRNPYMLNCYDTDIVQFSLVHGDETLYDLTRVNDGNTIWALNAPQPDAKIDAITVNSILTNMVRVQTENFECFTKDEGELAKYGLDSPAYTFSVVTEGETFTLQFPEFDKDDENVWCYDTNTCAVYSLSMNNAAFLSGKWQDLTVKQAMSVPFIDAVSLEMTIDGEKHTLSIDHEKQVYEYDGNEITAESSEDAAKDFEYLYASVSEIEHADYLEDIPAKMGTPTCTFLYKLADGSERLLELVPIDDESYLAYIDGICLGMTVSSTEIKGTNGCLTFVEKLNEDLGISANKKDE